MWYVVSVKGLETFVNRLLNGILAHEKKSQSRDRKSFVQV